MKARSSCCSKRFVRRLGRLLMAFVFTCGVVLPPGMGYAQSALQPVLNLPAPGTMVAPTQAFMPATIKGISLYPDNPLMFDFIVDQGDEHLSSPELKKVAKKLIKYFLASLTIPEKDLWVNLSPYEQERIIPEGFGETEMGRDMLVMDYMLKQLTASLMYPENEVGRAFWDRVYKKAYRLYGTTEIPVATFNKIWIVPESATVYEHGRSAFVLRSRLKVLLEEDYQALQKNPGNEDLGLRRLDRQDVQALSGVSTDVIREILIPEIEREVNEGRLFANLRQISQAMILATWYKQNLRESLLGKVYVDRNKTLGVDVPDKTVKQKIYNQYLKAFREGVYNYIREDFDPYSEQMVSRRYFSGGLKLRWRVGENLTVSSSLLKSPGDIFSGQGKRVFRIQSLQLERTGRRDAVPELAKTIEQRVRSASTPLSYNGIDQKKAWEQIVLYREQKVSFSRGAEDLSEALNTARDFLKAGEDTPTRVVIVENTRKKDRTTFGAVVKDDTVFIERTFLNEIVEKKNAFDMKTRVFIHLLAAGTPHQKRVAEYSYAEKHFPEEIKELLPKPGVTIRDVLSNITRNILPLAYKELAEHPFYKGQYTFIPPTTETLKTAEALRERAEEALFKIGVSALNRDINTHKRVRLSDSMKGFSVEEQKEPVKFGTLAFAGNPPTIAHLLIAGLQAMAESQADTFLALLTKGDFRKPALLDSYQVRYAYLEHLFDTVFGGLLQVVPTLAEDSDPERGLNGEEKIIPLSRLNVGRPHTLSYTFGDDHFFSVVKRWEIKEEDFEGIVKDTEGLVRELYKMNILTSKGKVESTFLTSDAVDKISLSEKFSSRKQDIVRVLQNTGRYGRVVWESELTQDNMYYINMKAYKDFIVKFLDKADEYPDIYALTAEQKDFLTRLVRSNKPALDFYQAQVDTLWIPRLDTMAKLFLIQEEQKIAASKGGGVRVEAIVTEREGFKADPLRDALGVPTVVNPGFETDISSTKLRDGLVLMAVDKKIDVNLLFGLPVAGLDFLVVPQPINIQYLRYLVRHGNPVLHKSVKALLPRAGQEQIQEEQWQNFKDRLAALDPRVFVERLEDVPDSLADMHQARSIIRVWPTIKGRGNRSAEPLLEVSYQVQSALKKTILKNVKQKIARRDLFEQLDKPNIVRLIERFEEGEPVPGDSPYQFRSKTTVDEQTSIYNFKDFDIVRVLNKKKQEIQWFRLRKAGRLTFLDQVPLSKPFYKERVDNREAVLDLVMKYIEISNNIGPVEPSGLQMLLKGEMVFSPRRQAEGNRRSSSSAMDREATGRWAPLQDTVGGINLDPRLFNLQIKRDGRGVPLPIWDQPVNQMHIEGFMPVILDIQAVPVSQLPLLLGLKEEPHSRDGRRRVTETKGRFQRLGGRLV